MIPSKNMVAPGCRHQKVMEGIYITTTFTQSSSEMDLPVVGREGRLLRSREVSFSSYAENLYRSI